MAKQEPTKDSREYLRDMDDNTLQKVVEKYPKNIYVNGELARRKSLQLKHRRTAIIGK